MRVHEDLQGYTQIGLQPPFRAGLVLNSCCPHLPPRPAESNAAPGRVAGHSQPLGWIDRREFL